MIKPRQLYGLKELLAFTSVRQVQDINEHCYGTPRGIAATEGRTALAEFTDGSTLYVVTNYDAGYSELTPGEGATVSYWVLDADERKVAP